MSNSLRFFTCLLALTAACGGSEDGPPVDDGDASTPDAGVDAAPPDAGHDAGGPDGGWAVCEPDTRRCDGTVSMVCAADGEGWLPGRDCAEWGAECGGAGYCQDSCGDAEATRSYIGCEYFASPFGQTTELDDRAFDYRIVVGNPNPQPVEITVTRGHLIEARRSIAPGQSIDIALPWIDGVSFGLGPEPWESSVVADGAYRVVSTHPVIVTQFNPFHYGSESGTSFSYTNDASLLLPTHALGTEHVAASYLPLVGSEALPGYPGFIVVIGVSQEPTTVAVRAAGDIAADEGGRWPATARGETLTFTIGRGEVAQIAGAVPPACNDARPTFDEDSGMCAEPQYDVTGSVVTSSAPVAVFSGHTCAFVPFDTPACDHLETQLAAVDTWGKRFVTMPMRDPATAVGNLIRIIAARDDTHVTIDPPAGRDPVSELTLDAGEFAELFLSEGVSIESDRPIQVAQLLLGQNITDPPLLRGDPALTILVPSEQFRSDYVFITPSSYAESAYGAAYVLVSRQPGVPIELDEAQLEADWTRVGDRELAIVTVTGGAHWARSAAPFGLVAYGLGSYTSYAAPAGLNLGILLE